MNDLVQFIRDRLDEDERVAREAGTRSLQWRLARPLDDAELGDASWLRPPEQEHAERHDPARVLADVEAKRRILAECAYWYDKVNASAKEKHPMPDLAGRFEVAMPILCLLALPYASHPDYRQEWRP